MKQDKCCLCERDIFCREWCRGHYQKWFKYGTPISPYKKADNGKGCINKDGYKIITVNKKSLYEHRYIMERKLKRKLKKHEHIHHKDGNKLNNNEKNLELCSSQEHGSIEGKKANGVPKFSLRKEYKKMCLRCKKIFVLHSKYDYNIRKFCCYKCYWKSKRGKKYDKFI